MTFLRTIDFNIVCFFMYFTISNGVRNVSHDFIPFAQNEKFEHFNCNY